MYTVMDSIVYKNEQRAHSLFITEYIQFRMSRPFRRNGIRSEIVNNYNFIRTRKRVSLLGFKINLHFVFQTYSKIYSDVLPPNRRRPLLTYQMGPNISTARPVRSSEELTCVHRRTRLTSGARTPGCSRSYIFPQSFCSGLWTNALMSPVFLHRPNFMCTSSTCFRHSETRTNQDKNEHVSFFCLIDISCTDEQRNGLSL